MSVTSRNLFQCYHREATRTNTVKQKNPHLRKILNLKQPKIPDNFKEFNKMMGNPINRNTDQPQEITDYQEQYHNTIQTKHKVIVNKSRKIGATEAVIRSIAYNVFKRYKGHDIVIIAGNELSIAREILQRFYELFLEKPGKGYAFKDLDEEEWHTPQLIRRSSIYAQQPMIEFHNGTRVFCFAASKSGKSQSFRGPDDVICIFFSEAAHTGMLEDQPMMNALEPNLANRDDADLILESTPNGKRGFFFHYWMDTKEGKDRSWKALQWDYSYGVKYKVLSEKYVNEQKLNPRVDFAQEYCCEFTSTRTAAFSEDDLNYLSPENEPIDFLEMIGRSS